MIDFHKYPAGDVQTWSDYSRQWPDPAEQFLASRLNDAALARRLLEDGVRPIGDPKAARLKLLDLWSGLELERGDQDFTVVAGAIGELAAASAFRSVLHQESKRASSPLRFEREGGDLQRFAQSALAFALHPFAIPIVDYRADSLAEATAHIDEITSLLSAQRDFKRLWFRGQTEEYPSPRDAEMAGFLRLSTEPSLVPTLGRYVAAHPGPSKALSMMVGPMYRWRKPFFIWVMRQNPQWFSDPVYTEAREVSLRDDTAFELFLRGARYHPLVPTEIDDLRQWFDAYWSHSIWIWVLQQYGYPASMLDLTWDLDTALFFTHTEKVDGRFTVRTPRPGRLIYIFAEPRRTTLFWDLERVTWGDEDWNHEAPPRITAQRCGALVGSTHSRRNLYGHLVIARIWLEGDACVTTRTVDEVFPSLDHDLLFRTLSEARPPPEGLY